VSFSILIAIAGISFGILLGITLYLFSLKKIARELGINYRGLLTIEQELVRAMHDRNRAYIAAVGTELEQEQNDLGGNLQRILGVAAEQIRAKSVELTLFDSESGLTANSFIVGTPANAYSRGSLTEEELTDSKSVLREERDGIKLLLRPVRFAKKTFGVLQFEFPNNRRIKPLDEQLVGLFSQRVAITLLDSQFTKELIRMRRLSDESERVKTGFLANLSHELRGPLGIILNGTELALDGLCGPVGEQLKDTLRMIRGNGQHLLELVNDVLDFAKVEAGKITVKPLEMPLKVLLEDILRVAKGQAEQKKHTLVLEPLSDNLGVIVDRRHIRQMLINLLTNAIKYTPDGGKISIKAEALSENRLRISIKDSGVGIPESQRSRVFGAFERVEDNGYSEKQSGTGLGMPLTKRLAEANGGSVDFDSVVGEGSTFYLILPSTRIARSEDGSLIEGKGGTKTWLGRGEKILLLDAEVDSRAMLGRYLKDQGFVVFEIGKPKELIPIFRQETPELAIIDSEIEGMTTEEIINAVRAHPKGASIPLILLTPSAFNFDVENYLKLGVDLCLSKPLQLAETATNVRRLVDDYESR